MNAIVVSAALALLCAASAYAADPPLTGNADVDFAVSEITIKSSNPVVISVRSDSLAEQSGNEASIDLWANGKNVLNHTAKMAYDEKDYVLQGPGTFKIVLRCTSYKAKQTGCAINVKKSKEKIIIE